MNQNVNTTSNSSGTPGSEVPSYEPPVVMDYGTFAALTRGSGGTMGSDMWGASGAGGGAGS
jgi:hypothetical protein